MRKTLPILASLVLLAACDDAATVASRNISKAADQFEVVRRIVFYNGITESYILTIEGRCSLDISNTLRVTCKTGPNEYKKHYLGISDNVTYFAEQIGETKASEYQYRVVFRPSVIIPAIEMAK